VLPCFHIFCVISRPIYFKQTLFSWIYVPLHNWTYFFVVELLCD
jgi:hypothetical protein